MMPNGIRALCQYLRTHPDLEVEVGGRVYADHFPPELVNAEDRAKDVPREAVVFRGTASSPDARLDTIIRQPIEIVCMAATAEAASDLDLAVRQVLKDLDRVVVEDTFLHGLQMAGGTRQQANGETAWPECVRAAILSYDEREVSG